MDTIDFGPEFREELNKVAGMIDLADPAIVERFQQLLAQELTGHADRTRESILRKKAAAQTAEVDAEIRKVANEARSKGFDVGMAIVKYRQSHNLPSAPELTSEELAQELQRFAPNAVKRAVQQFQQTEISPGQAALQDAYQTELARIPRGPNVAIQRAQLSHKYQALGYDPTGNTSAPQSEPEHNYVTGAKEAKLVAEFTEKMSHLRGVSNITQRRNLRDQFEALGLNTGKLLASWGANH